MSIDELVLAISEWASAALPGTEVKLRMPADPAGDDGVSLYIVGFRGLHDRRHAMARRDPVIDLLEVELVLRVADKDPLAQARKVAELQFAAMAGGPITVAEPEAARALFAGLELPPGSGLLLRGEIARQRPAKPIPLVREATFDLSDLNRETTEPEPSERPPARRGRRQSQPA